MSAARGRPVVYRLVLRGELGDQFEFLFDGLKISRAHGTTVLTGPVTDQAHLAAILDRTRDLGLEIVSLDTPEGEPGRTAGTA